MATGRDANRVEIVVTGGFAGMPGPSIDGLVTCHEARDGALRWEVRNPARLTGTISTSQIALDRSGDVLVGWSTLHEAGGDPAFVSVEKYSGVDGVLAWKWSPPAEWLNRHDILIPVPDHAGNVWIGWNRRTAAENEGRAVVTVLDGSTGREMWTANVSERSHYELYRPGSLRMLDGGDAILMLAHTGREAGRILRVSGIHGEVLWDWNIDEINRFESGRTTYWVDEKNARVLLLWRPDRHLDLRVAALCLATGNRIWEEDLGRESGYDFKFAQLGKRGDLELWSGFSQSQTTIAWGHWTHWYGIPHPRLDSTLAIGSLHVVLAGADGSEKSRKFFDDVEIPHRARLQSPGQATREIHLAGTRINHTSYRWPMDARRWLPGESMTGTTPTTYRVVHSPSGKWILARQSWKQYLPEPTPRWELQMWD